MGHELTMVVSSIRLLQKQQNIFGCISFWSVALQGHPVQQTGGVHDWLIQTLVSTVHHTGEMCGIRALVTQSEPISLDHSTLQLDQEDVRCCDKTKIPSWLQLPRHNKRPQNSVPARIKGCLHYDTCTPYMYVVQVYGVHVS